MDQGGGQEGDRPHAPPRRADPGKVVEEGTGRPVAGASVQFFPMDRSGDVVCGFEAIVASKDDGSFQVAVPPGKGYLMVLGPTLDYVPKEIGGGTLSGSGQPGGRRFYAHDIIAYEVKAGDASHELTATLRPGRTLSRPRGRPGGAGRSTDAVILTRQQIDPFNLTWQGHGFVHARDGRFELHGFDPGEGRPRSTSSTPSTSGARRSSSRASRPARR